jgi:hypothetical protein
MPSAVLELLHQEQLWVDWATDVLRQPLSGRIVGKPFIEGPDLPGTLSPQHAQD